MMVPSKRMLWAAALAILPATAVAGLYPQFAIVIGLALAAAGLVIWFDAVRGREQIDAIGLRAPEYLRVTKDTPAMLPVTMENRRTVPLMIRIAAVPSAGIEMSEVEREITIPPGSSHLDWALTPGQRGDHALGEMHIEAASPMGLWQMRGQRAAHCTLRVYPNMRDRATAALFQKTAFLGQRLQRQIGKGREFENLRQYLPGDSFEDVDWKATARRGTPAVKTYRVEHAQEVYAVIDSSRLSMREDILERYIEAALHLALVAERAGDRFGLATFSDRTHHFVRARNGVNHFRLCRETIYNLRAERVSPDFREIFTSLQLNLRRRSLLIFFTSLDDALLAETFERDAKMLARRHLTLVNVLQTQGVKPLFQDVEPASVDGLYGGLAGQILWNRLRTLQIALQRSGIRMSIVNPAQIKQQVTQQYLDVKRRQAL